MLKRFLSFACILLCTIGAVQLTCCRKCELPQSRVIRVGLDWRYTAFHIASNGSWTNYNDSILEAEIAGRLRSRFGNSEHLQLVDTLPEYMLRIDSIRTVEGMVERTQQEPCYHEPDQSWIDNLLFGQPPGPRIDTFTVGRSMILIYVTLMNTRTGLGKLMNTGSESSQHLEQPYSADSVNCNPYYVTGTYSASEAMTGFSNDLTRKIEDQICKWENQ